MQTLFDRIYVKHQRAVQSSVAKILTGAEDREDAEQNCWMKAHSHLTGGGALSWTWLTEVARNEARMIRRSGRIRAAEELPEADGLMDVTACQVAHMGGKVDQIRDAIAALPDDLRVILQANLGGMTQAAIARRLGVKQQTVAKRIKKAETIISRLVVKRVG